MKRILEHAYSHAINGEECNLSKALSSAYYKTPLARVDIVLSDRDSTDKIRPRLYGRLHNGFFILTAVHVEGWQTGGG